MLNRTQPILNTFFEQFLDFLIPTHCLLCDHFVWKSSVLCSLCATKEIFSPSQSTINKISVYSLGEYKDSLQKIICRFKFDHLKKTGFYLAKQLFLTWKEHSIFDTVDCISSVPLSKKRFFERGFNQSEEIGKHLALMINKPYKSLLRKTRHCVPQMSLGKQERMHNVKKAYQVSAPLHFSRILLIDDVITTGSTLWACTNQLLAKNPHLNVIPMVLAKA